MINSEILNYLKKTTSILFLGLLLCNALGYTFVFLINEWQENHRVKATSFVKLEGDKLVFKMQLTLPYQSEWKNELIDGNTAIFEGEFFKSYEQIYQGDTLYTYYKRLDLSRDNIMALMNQVHENLNLFSEKHKTTSQKALEFSKHLTKDYVEFRSKILVWYKVEDLPRRNYFINTFYYNISLTVNAPPPIDSIA